MSNDERESRNHPTQPVADDGKGTLRFKPNRIVLRLLDEGPYDLNDIARWRAKGLVGRDDEVQFAQLIGYSLDGFGTLSYVDDEIYSAVQLMQEEGVGESEARLKYYRDLVARLRAELRHPLSALFECHPDGLWEDDSE